MYCEVWDAIGRAALVVLTGAPDPVSALPGCLVSGSWDGTQRVWDVSARAH
jgi:hypothetical protein